MTAPIIKTRDDVHNYITALDGGEVKVFRLRCGWRPLFPPFLDVHSGKNMNLMIKLCLSWSTKNKILLKRVFSLK